MKVATTRFQVDNGDMTVITLESGRRILADCKITLCADSHECCPSYPRVALSTLEHTRV